MKLITVRLLVDDFSRSLAFWRDTMHLQLSYGDESMGYAYFDTGSAGLELFKRDAFATALGATSPWSEPVGRQVVVTFRVDDVDAFYKELVEHGVPSIAEPKDRPEWRARTAHLSAPENCLIEIYSPLEGDAQ